MIGKLDPSSREVTVIGAGIAGLVAAHFLDKRGYRVTLIEAQERAGGLISTERMPYGIAESAAHSFLATPPVKQLCDELEVALLPVHPESRARFILRDGKLRRMPLKPSEVVELIRRASWVPAAAAASDERLSLNDWGERHLGKGAVNYLLSPFVRGIYGCSTHEISVKAAFPSLLVPAGSSFLGAKLRERLRNGKKPRVSKPMMVPKDGMGSLIHALERSLEARLGDRFQRGVAIQSLEGMSGNLMIATDAPSAGKLLSSFAPELASALHQVQYTPLVSVTVFAKRSDVPAHVRGVGVLVPSVEQRDCLGILFNSSSFDGRVMDSAEISSFTMMLAGSERPALLEESDESIRRIVSKEMREVLGLRSDPLEMKVYRWRNAVPQYGPRLLDCWTLAERSWCATPGHVLFGNYTGQVSIRGMIESAGRFLPCSS
jgi:oxygen-dependent protoporphyrinogen oxidase